MIYAAVGEAILLYGAPVWAHRLNYTTYAATVNRAQRAMLLTVCRGYRTVATDTLPVIAAILPADLAARRKKSYIGTKEMRDIENEISKRIVYPNGKNDGIPQIRVEHYTKSGLVLETDWN